MRGRIAMYAKSFLSVLVVLSFFVGLSASKVQAGSYLTISSDLCPAGYFWDGNVPACRQYTVTQNFTTGLRANYYTDKIFDGSNNFYNLFYTGANLTLSKFSSNGSVSNFAVTPNITTSGASSGLFVKNNTVFLVIYGAGGPDAGKVYSINTTNGASTYIGQFGASFIAATGYVVDGSNNIYALTATANANTVIVQKMTSGGVVTNFSTVTLTNPNIQSYTPRLVIDIDSGNNIYVGSVVQQDISKPFNIKIYKVPVSTGVSAEFATLSTDKASTYYPLIYSSAKDNKVYVFYTPLNYTDLNTTKYAYVFNGTNGDLNTYEISSVYSSFGYVANDSNSNLYISANPYEVDQYSYRGVVRIDAKTGKSKILETTNPNRYFFDIFVDNNDDLVVVEDDPNTGSSDKAFKIDIQSTVAPNAGWSASGGQTPMEVTMAEFSNKLYQTTTNVNRDIFIRTSTDGSTWSAWTMQGGKSPENVNMAVLGSELYQVTRNVTGNIYVRKTADGNTWTDWVLQPGLTTDMEVTMVNFNNKLYQTTVNSVTRDINMRNCTSNCTNPGSWSAWTVQTGKSPENINMSSFGGKIYQVTRDVNRYIYMRSSTDGSTWSAWTKSGGQTPAEVTMGVFNGKLVQTTVNISRNIFVRTSADGNTWTPWFVQSGMSPEDVNMATFTVTNKMYQVTRDVNRYIYMREFSTI